MNENELAKAVVDSAFAVHQKLGPGLFESTYQICLVHELLKKGIPVEAEKVLPVMYDGLKLDAGYRIDLLVGGKLIVELKSIKAVDDIHLAQIITYLKLSNCKLGLLINFNVKYIKDGIKRIANGMID